MRSKVTNHLTKQAKDFAQDWWHLLDNNCDGVLGGGEAAIGTAIILGQDPSHFQKMWDAWPFCLRGGEEYPPPHFMFHLSSEFHVHVGRFDRHPCFLEQVLRTVSNFTYKGNISKKYWRRSLKRWLTNIISIEEIVFERRLDTDKDGCLSEKEWTTYFGNRSIYKHQMSQTVTMPDFLAIANFRPQQSLMIGGEDVYASRCVTAFRFGLWSALSLVEGIPAVNHSAPCHTENQHHSPLDSTSILPWILVGCSLACFGLCMICTGAWYHGKCHHKLNHMQAKMENKMDASSMFDTELSATVSSLNSSFLDCLGLSGFQEDQLSLLQLVHPEDKSSMHSALAQCKGPNGCKSAPISCEVRLQHGCRGKLQQGDLQSNVKYMHVKLVMTLSSKSTIDVGLTRLSGNRTCPMPTDRAIVQAMDVREGAGITWDVVTANQVARRPCGAISNEELPPVVLGSNVSSNSVSSIEHSFKTAELRHIATLGIEEHWIIPSEHVSLVSEDVEQGGFGKVRRGLLLGSADVAVKSAITDASEQALASKCEVLANEVRLFRRIHHQNIVLFHGAIFTSGPGNTVQMDLVLEWVAGGNLE